LEALMRKPIVSGCRIAAFTFPEALVTIGLLILFTAFAGSVFYQGQRLSLQLERHDRLIQEKISLATRLPALCQEIQPPEWISQEQVFSQTADGLEVKYWHSDPALVLSFEVRDGCLKVKTPEGNWIWKTLAPLSVEFWKSSDRILGLVVQWTERAEKRTLYLSWGGHVL